MDHSNSTKPKIESFFFFFTGKVKLLRSDMLVEFWILLGILFTFIILRQDMGCNNLWIGLLAILPSGIFFCILFLGQSKYRRNHSEQWQTFLIRFSSQKQRENCFLCCVMYLNIGAEWHTIHRDKMFWSG